MVIDLTLIPRHFACAAVALALTVPAAAAVQDSNLPPPVTAWLAQAKQDCPAGFEVRQGAVETAELTGDGRAGYVIDPHRLVCAGSPHLFIGDGPASIELFVTLPSGEVVHTGAVLALSYRIEPSAQGGPPILAFQTHEPSERAGSIDTYRWDGKNFALLNRSSMAAPPVSGPDKDYQQ